MDVKPIGSNQTEVTLSNGTVILYSYQTPVAALIPGKGYVRTAQKWSVTTSKHINQWIDGAKCTTVPQSELDSLA